MVELVYKFDEKSFRECLNRYRSLKYDSRFFWSINIIIHNERCHPDYINFTVKHGGGKLQVWGCMAANGVGNLKVVKGHLNAYDTPLRKI